METCSPTLTTANDENASYEYHDLIKLESSACIGLE